MYNPVDGKVGHGSAVLSDADGVVMHASCGKHNMEKNKGSHSSGTPDINTQKVAEVRRKAR